MKGQALLGISCLNLQNAAGNVTGTQERAPIQEKAAAEKAIVSGLVATIRRGLARNANRKPVRLRIQAGAGKNGDEGMAFQREGFCPTRRDISGTYSERPLKSAPHTLCRSAKRPLYGRAGP